MCRCQSEWASEAWPTIEGTPVSSQGEHREHGMLIYFGMTPAYLSSSLRTLAVIKYQAPRLACFLPWFAHLLFILKVEVTAQATTEQNTPLSCGCHVCESENHPRSWLVTQPPGHTLRIQRGPVAVTGCHQVVLG